MTNSSPRTIGFEDLPDLPIQNILSRLYLIEDFRTMLTVSRSARRVLKSNPLWLENWHQIVGVSVMKSDAHVIFRLLESGILKLSSKQLWWWDHPVPTVFEAYLAYHNPTFFLEHFEELVAHGINLQRKITAPEKYAFTTFGLVLQNLVKYNKDPVKRLRYAEHVRSFLHTDVPLRKYLVEFDQIRKRDFVFGVEGATTRIDLNFIQTFILPAVQRSNDPEWQAVWRDIMILLFGKGLPLTVQDVHLSKPFVRDIYMQFEENPHPIASPDLNRSSTQSAGARFRHQSRFSGAQW